MNFVINLNNRGVLPKVLGNSFELTRQVFINIKNEVIQDPLELVIRKLTSESAVRNFLLQIRIIHNWFKNGNGDLNEISLFVSKLNNKQLLNKICDNSSTSLFMGYLSIAEFFYEQSYIKNNAELFETYLDLTNKALDDMIANEYYLTQTQDSMQFSIQSGLCGLSLVMQLLFSGEELNWKRLLLLN